ncbi:type VI secretion system tube protein Hcp [Emticicia sp. BO119]|uniref:type VI secretion system tube protein Hcp n=1 Tax=Emticicia sp. BO119 TaxID=2757768 RepID=UPI0015F0A80A|nr:type VI secretion system tube protein Hcp [Emticicia sp. BO119]MBA4850399.1 type VI secretion system tube protein Hcp [Emticicia sp. BO119]
MKKNICLLISMLLLSTTLFAQTITTLIKLKGTDGNYLPKETEIDLGNDNHYIEIYDLSYNFSNELFVQVNNPNVFPVSGVLSFKKLKSKSSPVFYRYNVTGNHFSEIEIRFFKRGGNNGQQLLSFMVYKFKICAVKAISDGNSLFEEIEMAVGGAWIEYTPSLPNGTLGTPTSYGWNFIKKRVWNGTDDL